MAEQELVLVRHGETKWSISGQHTSFTDLSLTSQGVVQAQRLGLRLKNEKFDRILVSPLQRAKMTAQIAGYPTAEVSAYLSEWNYGDFEGLTTKEIQVQHPNWQLFVDGPKNGESLSDITQRADRLLGNVGGQGRVALFTSGHIARVIAARWLLLPASFGQHLKLSVASISCLGFERQTRAITLWNETQVID